MRKILISIILSCTMSMYSNFFIMGSGRDSAEKILNSYCGATSGSTTVVSGPNGYMGCATTDNWGNTYYND